MCFGVFLMLANCGKKWLTRGIVFESDFKIVPGERLPVDTRMELPEMSYEQELLNTPVPFENRVAFLSEYSRMYFKEMSLDELVESLDMSRRSVKSLLVEMDVPLSDDLSGEKYDESARELLAEEFIWESRVDELADAVPAVVIAQLLSKGAAWVHEQAYALGVAPIVERGGSRVSYLYPKELAHKLRILVLHLPPAGSWYGPREAMNIVKKDLSWISIQVKLHGLKSGSRLAGNNVGAEHYPEETILALVKLAEVLPPPAGTWLTVRRMANILSKDRSWVASRVGKFEHLAEDRLTDINTVKPHYPPEVLEYLREELAKETPGANDWFTPRAASRKLNRPLSWVLDTLSHLNEEGEDRKGVNNIEGAHYSPESFALLEKASLEAPQHANGWVTVPMITRMLMKTRTWVLKRLKEMEEPLEVRLDSMNRPNNHYHPDVIDRLQLRYMIDEENAEA